MCDFGTPRTTRPNTTYVDIERVPLLQLCLKSTYCLRKDYFIAEKKNYGK